MAKTVIAALVKMGLGPVLHRITTEAPDEVAVALSSALGEDVDDLLDMTGLSEQPWVGLYLAKHKGTIEVRESRKTGQLSRLKIVLDYEILVDEAALHAAVEKMREE